MPPFVATLLHSRQFADLAGGDFAFITLMAGFLALAVWGLYTAMTRPVPGPGLRYVHATWFAFDVALLLVVAGTILRAQLGYLPHADHAGALLASVQLPLQGAAPYVLLAPLVAGVLHHGYQTRHATHPRSVYVTTLAAGALFLGPTALFLLTNLLSVASPWHFFSYDALRAFTFFVGLVLTASGAFVLGAVAWDHVAAAAERRGVARGPI